jgi:nitroimidazol reductase NimA-like FMN-containing flavoprotein (pyridoxamine 5'-phosphate oxidase superfamily)
MEQEDKKQAVIDFLKTQFVMSIATVNGDKPSSSVVLYVVDDACSFYFVTHAGSYKEKFLSANPAISGSVWEHKKMLVQLDGEAFPITDAKEREWLQNEFAKAVTSHPDFWPPLLQIASEQYVMFKITPTWMRALDLSHDTVSLNASPFCEITL